MSRTLILVFSTLTLALGLGCAHKQQLKPVAPPTARVVEPAAPVAAPVAQAPAPEALVLAPIYFDFDRADIHGDDGAILDSVGQALLASPERKLVITGHCDERGTVEYNIALGDRRAAAARDFLVRLGVAAERIRTISFGEAQPADPGHDEQAWARNRRDELTFEQKQAAR